MLKAKQVAELLGISERQIYDLAHSGRLPFYRFGRSIRFEQEDIERFKAECRVVVGPPRRVQSQPIKLRGTDPGGDSGLEAAFRKLGIKPRIHGPAEPRRRKSGRAP